MPPRPPVPAVLLALVLVLAACTGGGEQRSSPGAAATGDDRYEAALCAPQSLLPTDIEGTCGSTVAAALFTGLVDYAPRTGRARWGRDCARCMAAAIRSPDQQRWTIELKRGWRFHDGTPVTASSYVDSWNFAAHAANDQATSHHFAPIAGYGAVHPPARGGGGAPEPDAERLAGLEVVDETTFRVRLAEPDSQFPQMLGHPAFSPLAPAALRDPEAHARAPVGTGPFRIAGTWEPGSGRITLVRAPDHPGEPAGAAGVTLHVHDDRALAYEELRAGRLDVMGRLPADRVADARERFGDRVFSHTGAGYTYLGLPSHAEAYADDRIGLALSMAIDREEIIADVLDGRAVPAGSLVAPVAWGAREDPCGRRCDFHPARARRLYRRAGGLPEPVVLWYPRDAGHGAWIEAVGRQWQEHLGIRVEYRSPSRPRFLDRVAAQEVAGPFRHGWIMDFPSIRNYLEPLHATGGVANLDGYSRRRVDGLIDEANATADARRALRLYHRAEDVVLEDWHHIPLWFGRTHGAQAATVSDVGLDRFGRLRLADIEVSR